jgi:hypothetical protein
MQPVDCVVTKSATCQPVASVRDSWHDLWYFVLGALEDVIRCFHAQVRDGQFCVKAKFVPVVASRLMVRRLVPKFARHFFPVLRLPDRGGLIACPEEFINNICWLVQGFVSVAFVIATTL